MEQCVHNSHHAQIEGVIIKKKYCSSNLLYSNEQQNHFKYANPPSDNWYLAFTYKSRLAAHVMKWKTQSEHQNYNT